MKKRILLGMVLCALPLAAALYDDFRSPPDAVRPWCYWYWVNGNVDRETVTADLEAMKAIGFGGVLNRSSHVSARRLLWRISSL